METARSRRFSVSLLSLLQMLRHLQTVSSARLSRWFWQGLWASSLAKTWQNLFLRSLTCEMETSTPDLKTALFGSFGLGFCQSSQIAAAFCGLVQLPAIYSNSLVRSFLTISFDPAFSVRNWGKAEGEQRQIITSIGISILLAERCFVLLEQDSSVGHASSYSICSICR